MFLGMSKYESTSYLCTLFDIQCCQSVIRKLVYGFMCRLDSSVNYIIHGIGAIQVLRNADGGGGCLIFWKKVKYSMLLALRGGGGPISRKIALRNT